MSCISVTRDWVDDMVISRGTSNIKFHCILRHLFHILSRRKSRPGTERYAMCEEHYVELFPRRTERFTPSWWLKMSCRQIGTRPPATTILAHNSPQYIPKQHLSYYVPKTSLYDNQANNFRGKCGDRYPLVSLFITGSSSHYDKALWV